MLKFIFSFIAIVLLHSINLYSQNKDSVHVLSEVSVTAFKDKYATGSKVIKIDSALLSNVSGKSLTDLLTFYMPIYIKQDAGGLATIKFRGSSPDHTAIMFSGININSLTLGHSNLSEIPTFLFDDINVQFGGSGSLHGSDAIGGSINLDTKVKWNKGFNVGLQQDIGSFGNYFSGIKTSFSNKRLFVSIKVFRHEKENNFPFLNIAVKDFEKGTFVKDISRNAGFCNKGLLQETSFKFSENAISHFNIWLEDNYHEIQPNMSTNYFNKSNEHIQNQHIRLIGGFKYFTTQHKYTLDAGYVKDYQIYNSQENQTIATNSVLTNINYFNNNVFKGDLNIGSNIRFIKPEVYAYSNSLNETRLDFFASYKKTFFKKLDIAVNLRDAFVTDYKSHFTPSIGIEYLLINNSTNELYCRTSAANSYKTPTFNQRYWQPGGNPNLLPESGNNYEAGLTYYHKKKRNTIKVSFTAFQMVTNNLIQWVNDGVWTPKNIESTNNKGFEFNYEHSYKFLYINIKNGTSYSYTKATVDKSNNSNFFPTNKQLIYTPEHLGNLFININFRTWNLFVNSTYTGERFSENNVLEDYLLFNTFLSKEFKFKNQNFYLQFNVYNIFNENYQNQENYAMPGINYLISIKYNLTIKK